MRRAAGEPTQRPTGGDESLSVDTRLFADLGAHVGTLREGSAFGDQPRLKQRTQHALCTLSSGAYSGPSSQRRVCFDGGCVGGCAAGEQSFLGRSASKATIRTAGYVELMSLHISHLESVLTLTDGQPEGSLRGQVSKFLESQQVRSCRCDSV